jgi:hypothetical protein
MGASVFVLLFIPAAVSILFSAHHSGFADALFISAMLAGGCWIGVALPLAAIRRGQHRRRFQDRLRALQRSDQLALLLPLESSDDDDTRKIAVALARNVPSPAEVAPATAPDARGNEASPADHSDGARLNK